MNHQHEETDNGLQEQGENDELATISLRTSRSSSPENYERIQLRSLQRLRVIPTDISLDVTSNLAARDSNRDSVDTSGSDFDTTEADDSDPLGFQMNGNYRSIRLSTSDREPWHARSSTVVVRVNPYSATSLFESKYLVDLPGWLLQASLVPRHPNHFSRALK